MLRESVGHWGALLDGARFTMVMSLVPTRDTTCPTRVSSVPSARGMLNWLALGDCKSTQWVAAMTQLALMSEPEQPLASTRPKERRVATDTVEPPMTAEVLSKGSSPSSGIDPQAINGATAATKIHRAQGSPNIAVESVFMVPFNI